MHIITVGLIWPSAAWFTGSEPLRIVQVSTTYERLLVLREWSGVKGRSWAGTGRDGGSSVSAFIWYGGVLYHPGFLKWHCLIRRCMQFELGGVLYCCSKLLRSYHLEVQNEGKGDNKALNFADQDNSKSSRFVGKERERNVVKIALEKKKKKMIIQLLTYKKMMTTIFQKLTNIYPTTKNLFRKKDIKQIHFYRHCTNFIKRGLAKNTFDVI